MFTAKSVGKMRCQWCLRETECVEAKFQDGLHGVFCWSDLKKAEKARAMSDGKGETAPAQK